MKDPKVLEFLEMAKEIYVTGEEDCMCRSFRIAHKMLYGGEQNIQKWIEVKVPSFCRWVAVQNFKAWNIDGFWWHLSDREIRIRYFDWIIEQEKLNNMKKSRYFIVFYAAFHQRLAKYLHLNAAIITDGAFRKR